MYNSYKVEFNYFEWNLSEKYNLKKNVFYKLI